MEFSEDMGLRESKDTDYIASVSKDQIVTTRDDKNGVRFINPSRDDYVANVSVATLH